MKNSPSIKATARKPQPNSSANATNNSIKTAATPVNNVNNNLSKPKNVIPPSLIQSGNAPTAIIAPNAPTISTTHTAGVDSMPSSPPLININSSHINIFTMLSQIFDELYINNEQVAASESNSEVIELQNASRNLTTSESMAVGLENAFSSHVQSTDKKLQRNFHHSELMVGIGCGLQVVGAAVSGIVEVGGLMKSSNAQDLKGNAAKIKENEKDLSDGLHKTQFTETDEQDLKAANEKNEQSTLNLKESKEYATLQNKDKLEANEKDKLKELNNKQYSGLTSDEKKEYNALQDKAEDKRSNDEKIKFQELDKKRYTNEEKNRYNELNAREKAATKDAFSSTDGDALAVLKKKHDEFDTRQKRQAELTTRKNDERFDASKKLSSEEEDELRRLNEEAKHPGLTSEENTELTDLQSNSNRKTDENERLQQLNKKQYTGRDEKIYQKLSDKKAQATPLTEEERQELNGLKGKQEEFDKNDDKLTELNDKKNAADKFMSSLNPKLNSDKIDEYNKLASNPELRKKAMELRMNYEKFNKQFNSKEMTAFRDKDGNLNVDDKLTEKLGRRADRAGISQMKYSAASLLINRISEAISNYFTSQLGNAWLQLNDAIANNNLQTAQNIISTVTEAQNQLVSGVQQLISEYNSIVGEQSQFEQANMSSVNAFYDTLIKGLA